MCLSLEYRDIILGFLTGEIDLLNYIIILGKAYLWTCRCKETKPSFNHFERILLDKYQTEKYISFKSNSINLFKEKWRIFEDLFLLSHEVYNICLIMFKPHIVNNVSSDVSTVTRILTHKHCK